MSFCDMRSTTARCDAWTSSMRHTRYLPLRMMLATSATARSWAGLLLACSAMAALAIGCHAAGIRLCLFRRLTGVPCPTCGATRAALHLLHGAPRAAWETNPLASVLLAGAALYALAASVSLLLTRRLPVPHASPRFWLWTAAILLALLLLNWGNLIARGG